VIGPGPAERDRAERDRTEDLAGPAAIFPLPGRQARLVDLLLALAAIALAIVVVGLLGQIFFDFGDVILTFFLAWLIAFILSPVVRGMIRHVPGLPRVVAVAMVYVVLIGVTLSLTVFVAQTLVVSISEFVASVPRLVADLPTILQPVQDRLQAFGFGQVDVVVAARQVLGYLSESAAALVGPLQSFAVASLGAVGTLLIVVMLSVYMVIDQDAIQAFISRLVPVGQREDFGHLEQAVSRSFGGFLRGQALIGVLYGTVALAASAILGLDFPAVTTAASGILMAIPFFGPFVSWMPPVIVAVFTSPGLILPTVAIMGLGWFVVMNILQPRLMSGAVGLHPIVVLGSVIIGSKVGGVAGAIFGIPIAAVAASLFFHYLEIYGHRPPVAERAARRLEGREGRPIRVPREPQPGVDEDVPEEG
jgi:predicted PurR-regulated permease PerM